MDWIGTSGKIYKYNLYKIGTQFKYMPGNYIFAKETGQNKIAAVYIGETDNLGRRLTDNHEKMPCVLENGGKYICINSGNTQEESRREEESDLIANYNPICNS